MKKHNNRRSNLNKSRTNQSNNTPGNIRIIAGLWRGRKLPVHDITGLRPTTDRVKETLFNWLMNDIRGRNCLDCFAGAGSLGFESLSRGAASTVMIEKDPIAAKTLKQNAERLNANTAQIIHADCYDYLKGLDDNQNFDMVFIDPPFRLDLTNKICQLLETRNLLSNQALIYVETESELTTLDLPSNWSQIKTKTAGQVCYSLYQRNT